MLAQSFQDKGHPKVNPPHCQFSRSGSCSREGRAWEASRGEGKSRLKCTPTSACKWLTCTKHTASRNSQQEGLEGNPDPLSTRVVGHATLVEGETAQMRLSDVLRVDSRHTMSVLGY